MLKTMAIGAVAFAGAALSPVASAQATGDTGAMTTTAPVEDDDNEFPWGLLGLIGLAGLLGRKRDDRVRTDRH